MKVVPGTKCSPKCKNMVFGPVKYPRIFSSVSMGLFTGPKDEKVALVGFDTDNKGKF